MRHVVVVISILALAAALLTGAVVAQEASPAAEAVAVPEPLTAWAAAWETGDVEGILAAYTDDATYEEVALGIVTEGQDELRTHIEGLFGAAPDLSLVVTEAVVSGDRAAVEWIATATYTGQMAGLPPGSGQPFTLRGASILELEGDRIRADREYWDAYGFLIAVGALPAPEAAATPAA
jgi:steroid delta-isomerase-like uncharacterized protein